MLEVLLDLLSKDSLLSTAQLAQRLGASPALVEQMLADLVRAGYLQTISSGCQTACSGCATSSACSTPRVWMRTSKALPR